MENIILQSQLILSSMETKPEDILFTLEDQPIVSIGNMMGITGKIGDGKSQICEIFGSYWISPTIAQHNIKCVNNTGICLYIDTERSHRDCINAIKRIEKHTGIINSPKLIYRSFICIESVITKLQEIKNLLQVYDSTKLLIIDGLLDLSMNANDIIESSQLVHELISLVSTKGISIILTLHGNRGDKLGKGKGHIGDLFQRKAEVYLKINSIKNSRDKILTSNFANGKVRNGANNISTRFAWNDEQKLFVEDKMLLNSVSEIPIFKTILSSTEGMTRTDLSSKYASLTGLAKRTVNYNIKKALDNQEIRFENDLFYYNQQ